MYICTLGILISARESPDCSTSGWAEHLQIFPVKSLQKTQTVVLPCGLTRNHTGSFTIPFSFLLVGFLRFLLLCLHLHWCTSKASKCPKKIGLGNVFELHFKDQYVLKEYWFLLVSHDFFLHRTLLKKRITDCTTGGLSFLLCPFPIPTYST